MYELYVLETCPYCHKVMEYLDKNNIKYIKKIITDENVHKELLKIGGHDQVPFLYDKEKGIKLYESDDIIEFISENK